MPHACFRVIYSGRVQGVGFRYNAAAVARGFAVAGYVMNLPDGTVELVCSGERKTVEEFLRAVSLSMADNIRGEQRSEIVPAESFTGFNIRRRP